MHSDETDPRRQHSPRFLGIRTVWWVSFALFMSAVAAVIVVGFPVFRKQLAIRQIEGEGGEVHRASTPPGLVGKVIEDDAPEFLRPVTRVVLPETLRNDD